MTESFIQIAGVVLVMASISYATLILIFYSGWKKLNRNIPGPSRVEPARVTVIVAARNEERNILTLLGDLARQDYPADAMEVIVVDDLSTDRTAGLVKDFIAQRHLSGFRLIGREGQGPGGSKKAALTLAAGAAEGEIILATDADCRLPEGWVSALTGHFNDATTRLVAGPVTLTRPKTMLDRFQAMEFLGLVASGAGAAGAGKPFLCNGACMAYRREAFFQVKGYEGNEKYRSGDDVFLMHKIKKMFGSGSVAFALDPEALVTTRAADGFVPFIRQRARWASKSRGYRDFLSIFTAITVFVLSLAITGLFIAGFFYPASFILFAGLILCKAAVDLPLMNEILEFTGNKALLKWMVPFEAVYPFYVVSAGIISLFWRRLW
jgi:cellulose synthase/poly-beta-1,6-N-acetylglucosamine synthase-like glycosyltransferase